MKEKKYVAEKIENFQAEIPVEEYMKECVDVATFLEFCKECSNYGKLWCCLKNLQASPILKMNNGK